MYIFVYSTVTLGVETYHNPEDGIGFGLSNAAQLTKTTMRLSTREYFNEFCHPTSVKTRVKWVPVTTAWGVLRLRMEERPPVMEGSCEYME
jgi:hypothetical protein